MRINPLWKLSPSNYSSKTRGRRKRLTRFMFEQLEDRRVLANLTAVEAWIVDSQSGARITSPVIGEQVFPMANWTVSGATETLNYDVEYRIDGVSVYRGPTDFGMELGFGLVPQVLQLREHIHLESRSIPSILL